MPDARLVVKGEGLKFTPSQIPAHVVDSLARATLRAVEKYFENPEVQAEYKEWKKKRDQNNRTE